MKVQSSLDKTGEVRSVHVIACPCIMLIRNNAPAEQNIIQLKERCMSRYHDWIMSIKNLDERDKKLDNLYNLTIAAQESFET